MVETICNKLTLQIRKKMPEVDDERAEIINYGLQLIIGELPKTLIIFLIACVCRVPTLTVLALLFTMPYRMVSGGAHLRTHIGCIIATSVFYIGNAILSKTIVLEQNIKLICIFAIWSFSMIMIKLYAPADTEWVPILRKRERKIKQVLSYIIMSVTLGIAIFIKDNVMSNLLIFSIFFQTLTITRFMYVITNNKYGHEIYAEQQKA